MGIDAEPSTKSLANDLTPIEQIFVCNRQTLPELDPMSWSLTINGMVRQSLTIHYADLLKMPCSSYIAVLECPGDSDSHSKRSGRSAENQPWTNEAVANLEWIGVPVALLLERAGIRPHVRQVICAGPESFVREIELSKLLEDAMLAYGLNGKSLPPVHGGPVRLIVPGWSANNWVKWIDRMTLIDSNPSRVYANQEQLRGGARKLSVKSLITSPAAGSRLSPGAHTICGYAWSGGYGVALVEISVDGGKSWQKATLREDQGPRAWRGFTWCWQAASGTYTLIARAADQAGTTQLPHIVQPLVVTVE